MACGPMAEKFVDVRLSEADAELIDFALDLVSDAYADQAGGAAQGEVPHRSWLNPVNQLRRRCYIPIELPRPLNAAWGHSNLRLLQH